MKDGRARTAPSWIGAIDDSPSRDASPAWLALAVLWLVIGAWLGFHLALATLAWWGLVLLALGIAASTLGRDARYRHGSERRRGISIARNTVTLVTGPSGARQHRILDLDEPFGLTLLCSPPRERVVMAITTTERTLYIGADISTEERLVHAPFLAGASTVENENPVLDAIAPDGLPLELSLRDLLGLHRWLTFRDRRAATRCFLSDTHGEDVILDGDELRIGRQVFDLRAPLEWRALWFEEAAETRAPGPSDADPQAMTTPTATAYQATWVRQDATEAVLVALVPYLAGDVASLDPMSPCDLPELERAKRRDRRLMQAHSEAPPPRELRIGIERTYMVPLRAALDRAPPR